MNDSTSAGGCQQTGNQSEKKSLFGHPKFPLVLSDVSSIAYRPYNP
jgi:hypothetical protein